MYKEEEEELCSTENIRRNLRKKEVASNSTSLSKKRRTYVVTIVMQKTFLGLQNVMKCVDVHLKQLESFIGNVNKCAVFNSKNRAKTSNKLY